MKREIGWNEKYNDQSTLAGPQLFNHSTLFNDDGTYLGSIISSRRALLNMVSPRQHKFRLSQSHQKMYEK